MVTSPSGERRDLACHVDHDLDRHLQAFVVELVTAVELAERRQELISELVMQQARMQAVEVGGERYARLVYTRLGVSVSTFGRSLPERRSGTKSTKTYTPRIGSSS